jgi:hypothetical protein
MKIKFEVEYDTETERFKVDLLDNDRFMLKHSGSSYLRIMDTSKKDSDYTDGQQAGTIGGHCPGSEAFVKLSDDCGNKYRHLSFGIESGFFKDE